MPAFKEAFNVHKDLKNPSKIIVSIPSAVEPGRRKALYFFVRAAGDSEHGTPEFREWQWTEKEIDRRIKGIF